MNRRTITLLSAAALALPALTACQSQGTGTVTASPAGNPQPASTETGPCTADYGTTGTGLTISGGEITGTVTIDCFPAEPVDPHIAVVLLRHDTTTGQRTTPASGAYTTQTDMTVTAHCAPGTYTLAANITAIIDGAPAVTDTSGQDLQVTAADCNH